MKRTRGHAGELAQASKPGEFTFNAGKGSSWYTPRMACTAVVSPILDEAATLSSRSFLCTDYCTYKCLDAQAYFDLPRLFPRQFLRVMILNGLSKRGLRHSLSIHRRDNHPVTDLVPQISCPLKLRWNAGHREAV